MSVENVLKMVQDNDVKFVDFRFCDTRGKEQHVTFPVSVINEDLFEEGKMFDGSSIAGWKGINESDMILMPDPSTAVMDPFFDDNTLVLRCDIIEPNNMQGYERDPRSIAKRAEAYLKSTGIADTAFLARKMNFSFLMMFAGRRQWKGRFSKSTHRKRAGTRKKFIQTATWDTVRA
jgi:glutamine synthetase